MHVTYTQAGDDYLLAALDDGTVVRRTAPITRIFSVHNLELDDNPIRLAVERWAVEHPDSPLLHPSERKEPEPPRLVSVSEYFEPDAWLVARVTLGRWNEVGAWVDRFGVHASMHLSDADAERVKAFGLAALVERFPDHPLLTADREPAVEIPVLR